MQPRRAARPSPFPRRLCRAGAALVAAVLLSACVWDGWIPGERSWNPDIVVQPGDLVNILPLGIRFVGELDCYTRLCERRFRLIIEEPGQLTISLLPELASDDDQARLVLEGIQGVLARAGTGRGPRTDVPALAVSEPVSAGVYFVLLQSIGGAMPYQVTARLLPGEGRPPPPLPEPAPPAAQPELAGAPPPRLVEVSLPGAGSAGFDPGVSFESLLTFHFPASDPVDAMQAGAPIENPHDRMIRRFLAEELTRRGLRQAPGNQPADLLVEFTRSATIRRQPAMLSIFERYGFGASTDAWALGSSADTRATLVVDIVDTRSQRIAWHAQTTRGVGPGITPGERTEALAREAVIELLAGFPPR